MNRQLHEALVPIRNGSDVGIAIYSDGNPNEYCYSYIGFSSPVLYSKGIKDYGGTKRLQKQTTQQEILEILNQLKEEFNGFEIGSFKTKRLEGITFRKEWSKISGNCQRFLFYKKSFITLKFL